MNIRFNIKAFVAFCHDMAASALAWVLAYWLRFNFDIPASQYEGMYSVLLWGVPLQGILFLWFGLYKGIWRYASIPDLKRILLAVVVATLSIPLIIFMSRMDGIPRSVLLLDPILLLMFMGGSRITYRAWKEHKLYGLLREQGKPVLILGAGDAAVSLVKELSRNQEWRVVGLLDDDPSKQGRQLHGVKVLGAISDLEKQAEKNDIHHAILAIPSATQAVRRRINGICQNANVELFTIPTFDDLVSGRVAISQIRKIEVEDLLGREPVMLDDAGLHSLLTGKVVMVTGAGGSIGSELCRQIAKFSPTSLVLYELNEFSIYRIEQEFLERFPNIRIACAIGDVKCRPRLDQVMAQYRPAIVFHAAAYKHVPLMETENSWEAVRNNVLGTYTLARAAIDHGVSKFVMISTDKAVNPTNVMGATKRLAEMLCLGFQDAGETKFVIVRFGNVLGSAGSVIPKFQEQIARGGPVTVTHPEIIRYFMSIPEAAQLVLQAGVMGQAGEIYVLDMGEPVKIADLARDMIRLSGLSEDDVSVEFTGLRPGEKLYEELLADDETTLPTPHPKLRIARAELARCAVPLPELLFWLNQPLLAEMEVKQGLMRWIPEYHPAQRAR